MEVSAGERIGALVGLLFAAVVAFISLDLLTGGLLTGTRRAAGEEAPGDSGA
jgi:hypothetical protein